MLLFSVRAPPYFVVFVVGSDCVRGFHGRALRSVGARNLVLGMILPLRTVVVTVCFVAFPVLSFS